MNATDSSTYKISIMSQDELSTAINWARDEGWNPGIHDAAAFYQADPTGFLAGKYQDQIIATISAVKYGSDFSFIGLYIVKEKFRGKGFGLQIWEAAIANLAGRNIGLDGVLAQQDNYKKSGFKLAHRNIRFAGKSAKSTLTTRAITAKDIDFHDIATYDRQFFPAERSAFLKHWVAPENTKTLVIVENSRILGYGSIRACDRGFKIGPLNAATSEIACELFSALTAAIPEQSKIFLDVPEPNKAAIELAQNFSLSPVFETARMYTKSFPKLSLDKIFGITTFELG